MTNSFWEPKNKVTWKSVKYLKIPWQATDEEADWQFEIMLPEPLASWDVFSIWERERVLSMRDNLKPEDILYDVGAEHGWMSVVFAKMCKVFLIEPTPDFWPNIKATWKQNIKESPVGCFCGLIDKESKYDQATDNNPAFVWPDEVRGELIDKNKYLYLNESPADTKILSIDDLVELSNVKPTALTIDVEGWEYNVLKGAEKLLVENNIKLWVSIHPDLAEKAGLGQQNVEKYLNSIGYVGEHLATDHEEHWYFRKVKSE